MEKLILLLTLLSMSNALVMEKTSCPDVKTVDNFDVSSFAKGLWYCLARYPNEFEQNVTDLVYYEGQTDGNVHKFQTFGVPQSPSTYYISEFKSDPKNTKEMTFTISFGEPKTDLTLKPKVLLYDANNYYISYYCKYDDDRKVTQEYAWVTYRSKNPEPNVKAAVDEFLKSTKVIDRTKLMVMTL